MAKRLSVALALALALVTALALAVLLAPPDAHAAGNTSYVDDDLVECPEANFSTIQDAINNASADDIVIVCNGTYNEAINITKPLLIHSQNGSDVTFINASINGNSSWAAVNVNASGVTFGGDGQGFNVSNNGTGYGIAMYTGNRGVGDVDMTGNSIVGNVVHNCSHGMRIDNEGSGGTDIYGITVLNNTVYDCVYGIYFDNDRAGDVRDNTVEGNEVYGCNDSGIMFYNDENSGDIYGNDVDGNTVYDCPEIGIYFVNDWSEGDIRGNDVLNNSVHDCSWAGISFENINMGDDEGDIYENVVEGNTVYHCDQGIEFENEWQSDGDIYDNDVLDNDVYLCDTGIQFENDEDSDGDIYGNDAEGNTVYDCEEGIYFENDQMSDGEIRGNDVEDNTVYDCEKGIYFDNDENDGDIEDNDVLDNTVYNCSILGIGFENDGYDDIDENTVEDNTVYNCSTGINFYLEHEYSGTITDNTVFNNTVHHCGWGINLSESLWGDGEGDVSGNTVEENTVYNCSFAGISLISWAAPSVVGNSVLNNTVYNCYPYEPEGPFDFSVGILLLSGGPDSNVSGNTIEGNEVYNSSVGIGAWSLWCGNISNNSIVDNTVYNTSVGIMLNASWCMGGPFGAGSAAAFSETSGADGRHRLPRGGIGLPRMSAASGQSVAGDAGIVGEEFGAPEPIAYPGVFDNTVEGNTVYNYEEGGIGLTAYAGGWNYRNTVEGNTVYFGGEGEFYGGIVLGTYFGLMGNITVADNTVFDSEWGIVLWNFGDGGIYYSTVEGNTVYWCDICIDLYNEGEDSISNISIRDNVLYNQSLVDEDGEDGEYQSGGGIWMYMCDNISVHNNSIAYSAEAGLWIEDSRYINVTSNRIFNNSEGIYLNHVDNVSILRNDILDNQGPFTGIYIDDMGLSWAIEIHCNNIVGNGIGVDNWIDPDEVNATWNWWGNASGPSGDGDGGGDAVWDAEYEPWLNAPTAASVAGLALNATAVPSMVSVYDMYYLFGGASQDIYTLGPSYTDIIVEVNCSENPCNLCGASVNLSALLLQILPAGFVEDYVSEWDGDLQDDWVDWMDNLSNVSMNYYDYGSNGNVTCFYDYELWLEALFFWDEEYSEGDTALEEFFDAEYEGDWWNRLMELIFEELRLGQVQVPVDLWPCSGEPDTVYVPLGVVDFQLPLDYGWNLRSAPIKLDSNWDTIWDVYTMGDGLYGLEAFITWDTQAGMWVEPGPSAVLEPMYAYYIKMTERDQMGFVVDRAGPPMPVDRQLYAGWNLVGLAPDFLYRNGSLPDAYPFPAMDPWYVLRTVDGSWEQAINMLEFLDYTEYFYYRWVPLEKAWYEKYFWQEPFTVFPDGSGSFWGPPFLTLGGGFWVFMDSDDLLAGGLSYTPLPWWLWFGGGPP